MANVSFDELLKLSVPERIQLAEDLWDSIAKESEALSLTDAQKAEIERRLAEHERDHESAIPWEEVRERLRKRFE
ncbi:MAG: addiction module protein [Actinomycetota bacterium]|jgi:putative addiction module component (TIGR02574 family)|nr:addiction module protein [Rubrobacter sp.]MDQ3508257.1 addiction module protein [Actinomycetota bacterium]